MIGSPRRPAGPASRPSTEPTRAAAGQRRRGAAFVAAGCAAALLLTACSSDSGSNAAATPAAGGTSGAAPVAASVAGPAGSVAAQSVPGSSAAAPAGAGAATQASATAAGGPATVKISITADGGCAVDPVTVPAGPVTFKIANLDATAVNEVHLMDGDRIRGERENLAPGFDSEFSATLDGGSYQIYCPGAVTENQPFTVTGKAATSTGDVAQQLQQATVEYAGYVDDQAGFLVEAVAKLQKALQGKDLAAAQQAYAAARPFYERIEPVAESFGDLDPDIDARDGDVPAADWKGFHQIEKALFTDKKIAAATPFVAELVSNVAKLKQLTAQLAADTKAGNGKGYKPDEVANGAASLLEEVQKTKISGEEERYSRIDLVDFAANVEGSQQAFAALEPALKTIDPQLPAPITAAFAALNKQLDKHADSKALGGYQPYDKLTKADIKQLSDALLAVQEPLSQVSAKVASAG